MANRQEEGAVKNMYPEEAKAFMDGRPEGSYTLLDVRQPAEYEEAHLPGATLIPLPELSDSIGRLDPEKPTIVYCAVGGRSRMGAQLLSHQGLKDVRQIIGGIQAWEEQTATGPREFHLRFVAGIDSPEEVVAQAYGMEEALRKFHQTVRDKTTDPELAKLLDHLVNAEVGHKKTLLSLLPDQNLREELERKYPESGGKPDILEGGLDFDAFMAENEPFLQSVSGCLNVAMMIETQALDLYLRMAAETKNEESRKILYRISNEEKTHLAALGRVMDETASRKF